MIRGALVITMLLMSATPAYAQFSLSFEHTLSITMDPQYPAPNRTVNLSLQSSTINLDESTIVWKANGTVFDEGVGKTTVQTQSGPLGSTRVISAEVDSGGTTVREEARIVPSALDLLWESDSYIPPLYRGRALAGSQSQIRLQALPRFRVANAAVKEGDVVYAWYRNGALVKAASGRGKSTAILPGPELFGSVTFLVRASVGDQTNETSVVVQAHDTPLSLYENHPLFGVLYHRSLEGSVSTLETEQSVTVVPYFAATDRPSNGALSYEWSVNGNQVAPNPTEPETFTIRTENFSGPALIELVVTSAADIVMRAAGKWELLFGNPTAAFDTGNPFGN